jgi:hypothetical protein
MQNDRIGRPFWERDAKLARFQTMDKTRQHTINFHQLLIIDFLFLIIESLIKVEGLRLHIFMLLLIRFRIANVVTKPRRN